MKKLLLTSLCVLLYSLQIFAQDRTITGTVTSKDDGTPIPGVGVKVKSEGTTVGTTTGGDGKYSLKVPSTAKTLVFSFIGYATLEKSISGNVISVALEVSTKQLTEVVVTGVGVATKKSQVAIDVASVSSKDFGKSSTTNITQALTGQIAGAQIIQRSGTPGAGALIILRGYTNLGSSTPLIIVDGVQVSSDLLTAIDPNTVDHVEVVKGAAGGMLYGAQGGNGVIQIFTKKAVKNAKLSIDFSSKYSNDRVVIGHDLIEKYHHYVTNAAGAILDGSGNPVVPYTTTGSGATAKTVNGLWTDPAELPYATDPTITNDKPFLMPTYDHVRQGYVPVSTYVNTLNIRGGSEKVDYTFGINNLDQGDVFSNSYNRTNLNFNIGFSPVTGLTIRNSSQLYYTHNNLIGSNRFNLVNSLPFIDFNYIDPTTNRHIVKPSNLTDGNNALAERDVHQSATNTPRLLETFNVNYKFPKFVELDYKFSMDYRNIDSYDLYLNQTGLPQLLFFGNIAGQIQDSNESFRVDYSVANMYVRTDFKNDFHINLPIKTTTQFSYDSRRETDRVYTATGTGILPFPPSTLGSATTKAISSSNSETLLYGYLVNQTIDYGTLFGVSGGFRADYSSAFGGQSTAFIFPRATAYFNPSELFKSHDLLTSWKLRGAYGEAGVQPGAYDRQVTLTLASLGTTGTSLYTPSAARNSNLQVQVTKETEVGTDFSLKPFKGNWASNFAFSASYWKRASENVIQNAPVSPTTGAATILDNLISLSSQGIDLSLDVDAYKSKNFDWYVGVRFAKTKTTITKLANGIAITAGAFNLTEGQELGILMGQTPLHSVDQLKPDGTRYIATTDVGKYTMVDGNVVSITGATTNQAVLTASNDVSVMGNTNPKFTSSLINRFVVFKKLSASVQFDWNHGQSIYNQTRQWLYRDRVSSDFDEPVTINGKTGAFVTYYNSYYNALNPVSWFVEDGSFIRMRDISLSYDFTSLINQKWLKGVVLTVSGRNLATWTNYKGLDPESTTAVSSQGGGLGSIGSFTGVDYYSTPNLKSYQFSLNISF
ncbi:SusC/RagA family TonB-linked outer membrane protein [Mucilaginibacter sp. HMF5004]|uniref:SusC/RagA family TonB-linked outer membrane protein n=1 Tax=Mucilaginibacter rivuli TaxID=2857527 RepID=UPI001C5D5D9D|nr:SusC/RagA family TonB-linked outer membrane protein [Mucilaginibacter rivuli]MBW4888708.1 SusC/RagA family TonB-linked outer membrane protein [Mucilaginibacter rivuli]